MRLLLIFFCLIEFRNNSSINYNVLFFILAKLITEKMKQKESIEDLYKVTKIVVKNFNYLKQENEKQGKDEFVLREMNFFLIFKLLKLNAKISILISLLNFIL